MIDAKTKEVPKDVVDINAERVALLVEKTAIAAKLSELGITYNRYVHKPHTIPDDQMKERKSLAKRYTAIEKRLTEIKSINRKNETDWDFVKDILVETFGRDFKMAVIREMIRRKKGQPPIRVSSPSNAIKSKNYKQEYNDLLGQMIEARRTINDYIRENEPDINKADYLRQVSKINKAIKPVAELQKMKIR